MNFKNIVKMILITAVLLPLSAKAFTYSAGLQAGYNGGPGFYLNSELSNFARQFPFKLRLGIGWSSVANPGNALDARKIFINNATNGRPEKKGWLYSFRMDLLYPVSWFKMSDMFLYGGPRYSMFTANFYFVDGNEDFDITSDHWGWGMGLTKAFKVSRHFDFQIDAGLDYFLSAILYGHDTSYSPDNENVNPREDFKYDDADGAINQPRFNFRLMMGLNYAF